MGTRDAMRGGAELESSVPDGAEILKAVIQRAAVPTTAPVAMNGIFTGELIAIQKHGDMPLVRYPGQPGTAALAARSLVDLHCAHIGKSVALMFESADPKRPIIMGVLRGGEAACWPLDQRAGQVEVDSDGERVIVSAKNQLILRCGKASITLTRAGKVLIEGDYVLSRSSGMNRIKGGSVQIN